MKVTIKKRGRGRFDVRIDRTRPGEGKPARVRNVTREELHDWVTANATRMSPKPMPSGE